jgi:hypothetical protein
MPATFYDTYVLLRLFVGQDTPTNVFYEITMIDLATGAGFGTFGGPAGLIGAPARVGASTLPPPDGMSFGHVAVTINDLAQSWLAGPDTAWVTESAAARYWRLCTEERIPVEIIGDYQPWLAFGYMRGDIEASAPLGPQLQRPLLDLLRECVETDGGVLISRRTHPGLVMRTRQSLQTQRVQLRLDAGAPPGDIAQDLEPVLDDQRLRNDVVVASDSGTEARVVDAAGVTEDGKYDTSLPINGVGGVAVQPTVAFFQPGTHWAVLQQNDQTARWQLHLGTWPGQRFPTVTVNLALAPDLIDDWHDLALGDRVQIVGLPVQWKGGDVELLAEAVDERVSPNEWMPTLTCSPGGPWLVGLLADDYPPDDSLDYGRLVADGETTLTGALSSSATTIPLTGTALTDDPDHYPLDVMIGGERITAAAYVAGSLTGCTRSGNRVTKAHDAGAVVELAEPFRLALGFPTTVPEG